MKICRICDEYYPELGDLGYLLYFENTHRFYIEIADGLDYWYAPPIMDWYIEHGIEYVDAEWSLKWVQNRIIPPDRQNIDDLVKRDKLHPVKTGAKSKLFMRSEVDERLW